jgi:hypothetical protein
MVVTRLGGGQNELKKLGGPVGKGFLAKARPLRS